MPHYAYYDLFIDFICFNNLSIIRFGILIADISKYTNGGNE